MPFALLLIFALLPSLLWLLFFLKRDPNPEPHFMIIKVFLIGILMVVPAVFAQIILKSIWPGLIISLILASFVEELMKYLAARWGALKSNAFDEPVDAMIYMITAGLGFAAIENLIVLINPTLVDLSFVIGASAMRFLTATFIHALTSGLWGYFIALQRLRRKRIFFFMGLGLATLVHSFYNLGITGLSNQIDNYAYLAYTLLVIIPLGVAILDVIAFNHLKKISPSKDEF
jgi:protease PrsW